MGPNSNRWIEIAPSEFPWERQALDFVRERLPDHEPYRAWSNFEFIAHDGSVNEVDLLVVSPKGFFLVEIKSRPGIVEVDAGTWSWRHEGKITTRDNPLLLAERKARKLKDLLAHQSALKKLRCPYLKALVFLSDNNQVQLPDYLADRIHTRDVEAQPAKKEEERPGIVAALVRYSPENPPRHRLDKPVAKAIGRALEQAGVRPSQRHLKVGDYQIDELLFDGPNYQDWLAHHVALEKERCRLRIYSVERGAARDVRESIAAAAKREYQILHGVEHDAILKPRHYTESERGPALVFDHHEEAQRFDHFIAEHGERLSVTQRLDLIRQLAEAVRFAHARHLVHRALAPQSILVLDPAAAAPRLQIFNWQTGVRRPQGTDLAERFSSGTSHPGDMVEDLSTVYMAPEALSDRPGADEQQDVFSLGALAYHLFAGQPPAPSAFELAEKLRTQQGLRISEALDGVDETLQLLIQFATLPSVADRLESAEDFLAELDKVEDELTEPEHHRLDPAAAKAGDRLPHGFLVVRRLGKGSTATALLVKKADEERAKEQVLKIALDPRYNERLRDEAEVLEKLRHQFIVQLRDVLEINGRVALLVDKAGDETLAHRLRKEGRLGLELLERFGEDLLKTLDWLEQQGIPHRDVKPENLGVAPMGRGDMLHLVLFDFSLARTPAENVRAGTVPYLDPFLPRRKPPRWDTYAERFAAAMTLHQMATGQLPRWGDGLSDPAVLDVEVTLDPEAIEPALRDKMTAFFAKALRSDYTQRFDNAEEMLAAWKDAFAAAGEPAVASDHDGDASDEALPMEDVTLPTPLILLGFSTRALNALDRVGATTVEELLKTPLPRISHMRGVGSKTRREIAHFVKKLAERFPDVQGEPVKTETPSAAGVESASVDTLAAQLLPASRGAESSRDVLRAFLRLDAEDDGTWPNQSDVARRAGVTRARIGQVLAKARTRWSRSPALNHLRDELAAQLDAQGGVMTATELAAAVLARRGSEHDEPQRTRHARAAVRAALEAERERAGPRWIVRRPHDGGRLLVALDELDDDGTVRLDGHSLADYAERLGKEADELADADPLLPPDRVVEALQALPRPPGMAPLPATRLRRLAAATARRAALSGRLELYPRGMDAARALKLALGALAGAKEIPPEGVAERVLGRYPEAQALPERPQLDALLQEAGSELRWDPEKESFVAPRREFTTLATPTSYARSTPTTRFEEVDADEAEVKQFHKRLLYSLEQRHFLALVVPPRRVARAERVLQESFPLDVRSFDEILIRHMRAFAAEKNVSWDLVLRTDATPADARAGNRDWANLLRVVRAALPRAKDELAAAPRNVLLTHLGLLARYGELTFVDELRDAAGRPGGPPGLWLLVPSDAQDAKPTLDGHGVPVFTTAQWARVPEAWIAAKSAPETRGLLG